MKIPVDEFSSILINFFLNEVLTRCKILGYENCAKSKWICWSFPGSSTWGCCIFWDKHNFVREIHYSTKTHRSPGTLNHAIRFHSSDSVLMIYNRMVILITKFSHLLPLFFLGQVKALNFGKIQLLWSLTFVRYLYQFFMVLCQFL